MVTAYEWQQKLGTDNKLLLITKTIIFPSLNAIHQLISFKLHIRKSFPNGNHLPAGTLCILSK
jgi:hypothetical protein